MTAHLRQLSLVIVIVMVMGIAKIIIAMVMIMMVMTIRMMLQDKSTLICRYSLLLEPSQPVQPYKTPPLSPARREATAAPPAMTDSL